LEVGGCRKMVLRPHPRGQRPPLAWPIREDSGGARTLQQLQRALLHLRCIYSRAARIVFSDSRGTEVLWVGVGAPHGSIAVTSPPPP
jgi:hypothetical protein